MPLHGENQIFPAYSQLRQIPGGANGLIHLGVHVGYGIACVQKTYDRPGRDDAIAFAEPRLLRSLDHPHIVRILDAQPDGDRDQAVTMVMPAYSGGSLYDTLARGTMISVGRTIEFLSQIAGALDYLHTEHRLLHRDIKPQNLLMDGDGSLLLCDFGTAAVMSETGHTAAVRASMPYQPPETAGLGWMAPASDVYSLGLTAIEMLEGRFLYDGLDAAVVQTRVDSGRRAYTGSVLAAAARPAHIPAALRTLLGKCVAVKPTERPTAAQLARDLDALIVVDWRHVEGSGNDGRWLGTWPARARADRAVALDVTSRVLTAGRASGRRRLEANYRRSASKGWRTVGGDVSPLDVDPQDSAAVSRFFKTVSDIVAQRFPA
jgi:serine/threonine protein kinase